MSPSYCTYILRCADGSYYVGVTNNLDRRIAEHNDGLYPTSYTYTRRPVRCVYVEATEDVWGAIAREKQWKRWSKKKKEALIRGDETALRNLSHHRFRRHYDWRWKTWWLRNHRSRFD